MSFFGERRGSNEYYPKEDGYQNVYVSNTKRESMLKASLTQGETKG